MVATGTPLSATSSRIEYRRSDAGTGPSWSPAEAEGPMTTAIVTDSSACLPPRVARELGVRIVPIGIVFGQGDDARDDTVDPERVHRALARHQPVKSVPPSALDYLSAIEASPEGHDVVVLTPATEFTVMCRTAQLAAGLADRPVEVVDTRTAASAQGLVVEAAA